MITIFILGLSNNCTPVRNGNFLFTDTDSLTHTIKAEDINNHLFRRKELFDFSEYSRDSQYNSTNDMKKIGKMKDVMGGVPITEFMGLRGKLCSVLAGNGSGYHYCTTSFNKA